MNTVGENEGAIKDVTEDLTTNEDYGNAINDSALDELSDVNAAVVPGPASFVAEEENTSLPAAEAVSDSNTATIDVAAKDTDAVTKDTDATPKDTVTTDSDVAAKDTDAVTKDTDAVTKDTDATHTDIAAKDTDTTPTKGTVDDAEQELNKLLAEDGEGDDLDDCDLGDVYPDNSGEVRGPEAIDQSKKED